MATKTKKDMNAVARAVLDRMPPGTARSSRSIALDVEPQFDYGPNWCTPWWITTYVLQRLADTGVLKHIQQGRKHYWKLTGATWDLDNPLAPKQGGTVSAPSHDYNTEINALFQRIESVEQALTTGSGIKLDIHINAVKKCSIDEHRHPMLERILKLTAARLNVLMVGPAGSGKTYLGRQIGKIHGLPFGSISCSAGMSEGQLLGRLLPTGKAGQFEYAISEFVRMYEQGGVFLLDELDAADSNTIIVLNTALSSDYLAVPNRTANPVAQKHPDFICLAAANTHLTGADRIYVGRNQLDEATVDRFRAAQVHIDYDAALEKALCPDDGLRLRLLTYRANMQSAKIRRVISTRFLQQAYVAKQAGITDAEIDESLFGGWKTDEINKVKGAQ